MLRPIALTLLTLAPLHEALASDFPMWGAGVRVGTIVVPGAYPMNFPKDIAEDSTLAPARFDLSVGLQGLVYADNNSRIGAMAQLGFGSKYNQSSFLGTYEVVLQRGSIDFLAGGGLGFGSQTWRGESDEVLRVPSYPARAQITAQYRRPSSAYALSGFVQANIPSRHIYTQPDGTEDTQVGSAVSFANYLHAGLEFSVLFGDFKIREAKKKGGKKGEQKGKNKGKKGGKA